MAESSLTTLVSDEIQGNAHVFVDGEDRFFYGIPCNTRRVVKFNPLDKSFTEIGPDLGWGVAKWVSVFSIGGLRCVTTYLTRL